MAGSESEKSQIRCARLAGFLYLFTYPSFMLGISITGRLEVPGNSAESAHKIMASQPLYRFGLLCYLITYLCCIALAMGLYVAVKPIDNNLALFALLFRSAENILGAAYAVLGFVALNDARSIGFYVAMIFLGLGSLLFFFLFLKSNYIPKVLSAWGVFASVLFTIGGFALLLWPQYGTSLQLSWLPMALAELSVGLWLLVNGLNLRPRTV